MAAKHIDKRQLDYTVNHDSSVRYCHALVVGVLVFVKWEPNNTEILSQQVAEIPKLKLRGRGLRPFQVTKIRETTAEIALPRER